MTKVKTSVKVAPKIQIRPNLLTRLVKRPGFSKIYVFIALLILLGSTVLWSVLSARVHAGNADQLVNPYLFDSRTVMRGAILPSQHTFLLKWPVFFITKFFGESTNSYIAATVSLLSLIHI